MPQPTVLNSSGSSTVYIQAFDFTDESNMRLLESFYFNKSSQFDESMLRSLAEQGLSTSTVLVAPLEQFVPEISEDYQFLEKFTFSGGINEVVVLCVKAFDSSKKHAFEL